MRQLLLFLFSCGLYAQDLQSDLQQVFTNNPMMGMSVYAFSGDEEAVYNFGLRNLSQNLAVTNDTKYRIASISKSFTALGLMKLYDQDLFGLDDDISTYLGYTVRNPNFPNQPITFRMVLSHTSSLQDGTGYGNFLNATYSQNPIPNISSVLVPGGSYFTANMWRTETPGTFFAYSNLNFGLIGTLIEKISNQRFDIFMKNEILIPLGIAGSFNIQDLTDIGNVAVIYRNISGWSPQADNFNGVMPPAPNLAAYVIGSNGVYFGPQGGFRTSVSDIGKFLKYTKSNGLSVPGFMLESTLAEMKNIQWNFNGNNGDNYYGLFNKWGLGLHYANTNSNDFICEQNTFGNFIGHTGEAYGLVSDAFYSEFGDKGFVFVTNGSWNGYQTGPTSFYTIEDAVFSALCNYFTQPLSVSELTQSKVTISPNPSGNFISVQSGIAHPVAYEMYDLLGRKVIEKSASQTGDFLVDLTQFNSGTYFLQIHSDGSSVTKKIIKK